MRLLHLIVILCISPFCAGAIGQYPYEWEANRQRATLSAEEELAPEIILKEHVEYAYTFENNQFIMYFVHHRIVRVNNSEAIQRHNRITVSMERTIELVELKARSINRNNQVIEFDKSRLKEVTEEGSDGGQRIFAMEGVELGSEIEYFYVRKMGPSLFRSAYLQMDVPIKTASFTLKCPKHLEFDFKGYNGLPEIVESTTEEENIYKLAAADVPPIEEEEFAYAASQKKRVEFKLAYNTAKSKARLYTWDDAGKEFYSSLYSLDKDDTKALEKFVKGLKDDPAKPLTQRIRSIERQIKTTIQLEENQSSDALSGIPSITRYKVASKYGFARLLLHVYRTMHFDVQVVVTCDREFAQFDEDFDTWSYLDEYVLYFPQAKGFLSPYNPALTFPIIEPEFTSQKGLFIEPIEIGSVRTGLASIKEIPAAPFEWNTDNLDITVNFDADVSGNEVRLKREFKGYNASYIAPYYHLIPEDQKLAIIDDLLKQTAPGLIIKQWTASANFERDVDQFDMDVTFTSSHFVERAGPRVLFKVGLLIGPQTELYRDDKRMHGVENDYNRGYERVLRINIPQGYSIKNPDDLNFKVLYHDGDKVPFSFESSYTIEGQTLTVLLHEYYRQIYAPLDRYEDYRKVINAAADFNKVTLVLEKKSSAN